MPQRKKSAAARLVGLDVLRGLAAGAVMLHHHGQYYDVLYPGRTLLPVNFEAGHFGVELFFIISGFVILMTIERKGCVWSFASARAKRLLPCFLAALMLATLILYVAPMPPPLDPPTAGRFIANMTMVPMLLGQRVVDLPYWTLTYEMVFYACMALVVALGRLRSIEWIGLGWMAVGVAFTLLVDVDQRRRTTIVLLAYYSNFFVIGMCLYLIRVGRARPVTWLALAAGILASLRGGGEQAFYASSALYFSLTVAFTVAVWLASSDFGRLIAWPPVVFLGRISYPLYLVHVVIGFEVIRYGVQRGWSTAHGVAAAAAVSLLASILLHYLVERPARPWSRERSEMRSISSEPDPNGEVLSLQRRAPARPEVHPQLDR